MQLTELRASVVFKPQTEPLEDKRFIHSVIADVFSQSDLRSFIFKISERERDKSHGRNEDICSLSYEGLPGDNKLDTALELVLFMRRHGRFSTFKKMLKIERDWVDWDAFK